jgi:DUF1365 family protein
MAAVDVDHLGAMRPGWVFAHNRAALLSIVDKDHGFRDGRSLRAYAEAALAAENLQRYGARLVFVTMPRFLGYAFNPISFYYCYDAAGTLGAVLHQVKNTFGDQVGYLMPVHDAGMIRQAAPKRMHVSPFFDMRGGYRFALTALAEKFTVSIQYGTKEEKRMTATMSLTAQPWTDRSLLGLALRMPFTPMKVMFAIHWQALKLFLRGARFHGVPKQPHAAIIAGDAP